MQAAAREKLNQARAEADNVAADARSRLESLRGSASQTVEQAKQAASHTYNDAARKAEETYDEAKRKASEAVHKAEAETQSWGQWLGSWFGYGKTKVDQTAEDLKRDAAQKVAQGAGKVESEANKRA